MNSLVYHFSSNDLFWMFSFSTFLWKLWMGDFQSLWRNFSLTRKEQRTEKGHTDDQETHILCPSSGSCRTMDVSKHWIKMFSGELFQISFHVSCVILFWIYFIWLHCGTRSDFRKHHCLIKMLQTPFQTLSGSSFCVLDWGSASFSLGCTPRGGFEVKVVALV